jgi:hypothetical protein
VYVVDFAIDASDENAEEVAPHAPRFRFEVRQPSPDATLEIIRRRGMRAFFAGDYDVADRETRELLRLHPESLLAYVTLGQIAEKREHTGANALPLSRERRSPLSLIAPTRPRRSSATAAC